MECMITGLFFDLIRNMQEEQKKPKDYGTGQQLFHSEANFLDTISKYPTANASRISEILGITKGATTQLVNRLIEKGLIESYHEPNNKKAKYLRLTPSGELVQAKHKQFHKQANERMRKYLCSRSERDKTVILDLLIQMKECWPFLEFDCCEMAGNCFEHISLPKEHKRD